MQGGKDIPAKSRLPFPRGGGMYDRDTRDRQFAVHAVTIDGFSECTRIHFPVIYAPS